MKNSKDDYGIGVAKFFQEMLEFIFSQISRVALFLYQCLRAGVGFGASLNVSYGA